MHGRCHTRSPGIFVMRVDSQELPLSAIPLCQLLPCHLGPLKPKLSILTALLECYICTSWAWLLEGGPDPQCQAAQVANWIWWWQCLGAWHCRSVWSLPCHFAADVGCLALSVAKSHWHGALHSAHNSCTCGQVFWKRDGGKSSSLNFFQAVFTPVVIESSQLSAAESMSPR